MAEGLQSYIQRRRGEGQPLYFSNVGPGQRSESWPQESGSVYYRPEETWAKETEAEMRNSSIGAPTGGESGPEIPDSLRQSKGYQLNAALAELQKHIPGIVQHTLGGKDKPANDLEKQAVQKNIQAYLKMLLKDMEVQSKSKSGFQKQQEFEYYKGLGPEDKAEWDKLYGKDGKGGGEGGSFADKEQYKYLLNRLKGLDDKLTGEFAEDLNDEERAKIQGERQTVIDGMLALENRMGGKGGMQRAQGGEKETGGKAAGQPIDKRAAIQKVVAAGASKDDIKNFIRQNPQASVDDFLNHFGAGETVQKKNEKPAEQKPSKLNARSEQEFHNWYKHYSDTLGLNPDPDAPEHYYDYRAAFLEGAEPNEQGHWPSEFKREGHPRMVVDGMNTKTGQPAEAQDVKNTPVNAPANKPGSNFGGMSRAGFLDQRAMDRKKVPYDTSMTEAPTKEQVQAAKDELVDLARKLHVGPEDWKGAAENYEALGQLAKEVGGWAWESYTNAIGTLLHGQQEARKQLPAYRG